RLAGGGIDYVTEAACTEIERVDLVTRSGDGPVAEDDNFRRAGSVRPRVLDGRLPASPAGMAAACRDLAAQIGDEISFSLALQQADQPIQCIALGDPAKVQREPGVTLAQGLLAQLESPIRAQLAGDRPEAPLVDEWANRGVEAAVAGAAQRQCCIGDGHDRLVGRVPIRCLQPVEAAN